MVRAALDVGLQAIQADVLVLGNMVERAIHQSIEALRLRDASLARQIIENDRQINALRFRIEEAALILIATQQPVLRDLRTLAAVLNIVTDLERIGDHAEGIATICLMLGDESFIKPLIDLPRMASIVAEMLRRALLAFTDHDIIHAQRIARDDDDVDALYNQVYRELLTYIMQDTGTIHQGTLLLWVAHNLERMGDRATNICERIVFTETGRMTELKVG